MGEIIHYSYVDGRSLAKCLRVEFQDPVTGKTETVAEYPMWQEDRFWQLINDLKTRYPDAVIAKHIY